jgi:mevalonate kinase
MLGDGSPVATAIARLLGRIGSGALDISAEAAIPSRAGLGSSAALAVAVARAAAGALGTFDDREALAAAHEAEAVFHGSPSGIDTAAAWHGGVGAFQKADGWRPLPVGARLELCVAVSGRARETREQVEAVGRLCAETPAARRVIEVLGDVSRSGMSALAAGDLTGLGRLFDVAHGLLAGLRVSSAELDALAHAARDAGALGAKLTGAGGGGAVIALAPGRTAEVLARWHKLGYQGFSTIVEGTKA